MIVLLPIMMFLIGFCLLLVSDTTIDHDPIKGDLEGKYGCLLVIIGLMFFVAIISNGVVV